MPTTTVQFHRILRAPAERIYRAFLDAFRLDCMPLGEHLANATPAGTCHSYPKEDASMEKPFAPDMVLIGDAAG